MLHGGCLLNLIDTPGHYDFSYEVQRAMRGCSGALLLVDASQGVQAQTLTNYEFAVRAGLTILPVLNKIDMKAADPDAVEQEVRQQLAIQQPPFRISARTGAGVDALLQAIIDQIPAPLPSSQPELALFLLNSWWDRSKGVVCLFQVKGGSLRKGVTISSANLAKNYQVFEVGLLVPGMAEQEQLTEGMIGYAITNMKQVSDARIGDTFFRTGKPVPALPGFEPAHPVVFAGLYSVNPALTP